jgi:AcrR family transcriptional regulator
VAKQKTRERIVEAAMALAGERPWGEVTLQAISERADTPLSDLRGHFDGRLSILAEYTRRIDATVLAGVDASLATEAPRERLFDVLFARFEAHVPHKAGLRNIAGAALSDPLFALQLNCIVTQSMAWMLAAAGIPATGRRGRIRAQGLALIWVRTMRVFLHDDEPGLPRTMAALDKRLREAERIAEKLERCDQIVDRMKRPERHQAAASDGDLPEGHPT